MKPDIDYTDLPDVLTVTDLQKVLQIGRSAAYKLIQTGQLKHIRIGRSIRIPKAFLLEFIKEGCFPVDDLSKICYDDFVTLLDKGLPDERRKT